MTRVKRWLAGAASAALLLGFVAPATGQADDAVEVTTNHAGPCEGDTGVTVVLDYQKLGGAPEVRCFTGDPDSGVEAIRGAGFTYDGTARYGEDVVCRVNGRPAVDEIIPIKEDPTYTEDCSDMPPANGYWSYWSSADKGQTWDYSQLGISNSSPKQGEWEGWSFSLNATASTNPAPRTGLALAPYLNADSTKAAADWIASQWDADADQFAAGLADSIAALAAAEAHPEVVSQMVEAMKQPKDPEYYSRGADSLAKMLIALDMTGQDPHNFLGCDRDLVAELDAFIADDAKSLDNWWGPHLVTIALNRLGKPVPQNVWDLLAKRQVANGSFGSPDDTGLALSALVGTHENDLNPQAMRDAAKVAIDKAVAWSNDPANQKTKDGNYYWATFAAANSTGILAGGLAEAGVDVTSPQAFMRGQQKLTEVGAWQSKLDRTSANYMATVQGIFAVAGKSYGKSTLEVQSTTTECSVKPAFSTQPVATTVTAGEDATFTVAVTGDPAPGITWEKEVNGAWSPIKDATGTILTLKNVGNDSNGLKVRAVAANAGGYAVSDIATLTVKPVASTNVKPTFTTQPASITVTAGADAVFTVAATGDPEPGITWEEDVKGIWTAIKGATGTTFTLKAVGTDSNGRKVRAVAANAEGYAVSNIAVLTVTPIVSPTQSPSTSPTTSASATVSPTATTTGVPTTTPTATATATTTTTTTATVTIPASPSPSVTPTYPQTVYNTPGYHKVNGRHWFTSCEKYSATQRCRTLIEATTVKQVGGKFVASHGWTFNNLTYLPAPKSLWKGNPLAETGSWTTADGRQWRTECNTPQTGGNGCRSFIRARVVANLAKPGQPVKYGWTTRWEFNNIVQFS